MDVPLITLSDCRNNLARIGAAFAALLVSADENFTRLVVEPKRSLTLAGIRAAIAAAGAPVPARAFTREEMETAIGQALEENLGRG